MTPREFLQGKTKQKGAVDLSFMRDIPDAGMSMKPLPGTTISQAPAPTRFESFRDSLPQPVSEALFGSREQGAFVSEDRSKGFFGFIAPILTRSDNEKILKRYDNLRAKGYKEDEALKMATTPILEQLASDETIGKKKDIALEGLKQLGGIALDVVGNVPAIGATESTAKTLFSRLAQETDEQVISKVLRENFTDLADKEVADNLARALKDIKEPSQVQQFLESAINAQRTAKPVTQRYWYNNLPTPAKDEVVVQFVEKPGERQSVSTVLDVSKADGVPEIGVVKMSDIENDTISRALANKLTLENKIPAKQIKFSDPIEGFGKSENQISIEGTNFVIGDYGINTITRKIEENLKDRLPVSMIRDSVGYITDTYKAGTSSFRKDNLVHIIEMPNGDTRALITRQNKQGKEEIINFFKVSKNKQTFVDNLKKNGIPERTRTSNLLVRTDTLSPLSYGDTTTVAQKGAKEKGYVENGIVFNKTLKEVSDRLSEIFGKKIDIFTTTDKNKLLKKEERGTGVTAYGRAKADSIHLLERNKSFSEAVANHEGWHWFKRNLSDSKRKELDALEKELFDARPDLVAQQRKNYADITDAELAEEIMAEEFARFLDTGRTVSDRLKEFFNDAIEALLRIFKVRDDVLSRVRGEFRDVKKTLKEHEGKHTVGEGANKQVLSEKEFKNFTDLSTKLLGKLEGKTTVSKQFISDLTNSGDLKQVERDLFRSLLADEGDKVNVKQFAERVKAELVPLKRKSLNKKPDSTDIFHGRESGQSYENIALPNELRGNVKNYDENIYESPINTSAGRVHFADKTDNYFGHTRIEDMADDETRRVIEVQSDLYQKGRLEGEVSNKTEQSLNIQISNLKSDIRLAEKGLGNMDLERAKSELAVLEKRAKFERDNLPKRQAEVDRLKQYNDPTAHFRMIREEVKKAAEDGKTRLQFPTGETAMKIEGLGENPTWRDANGYVLKQEEMKVGDTIMQGEGDFGGGEEWIITDVLGDGKFRAISQNAPESFTEEFASPEDFIKYIKENGDVPGDMRSEVETFDISGKVDQNNPIYKFYEKEVGKYLKNKYNAQLVTDKQGVSWWEMKVTKEMANTPVEAFKKINEIDRLIAEGKVRVVSRDGKDVYQVKNKDGEWVSKRDEDSTLKSFEPKPKAPSTAYEPPVELQTRLEAALIAKEMINENPAKELSKYVAKTGEFKGQLGEATGKKGKSTIGHGYGFDQKAMDLGFADTEEARVQYEKYRQRKADVEVEVKNAREAIRTARLEERALKGESKAIAELIEPVYQPIQETPESIRTLEEIANQKVEKFDLSPTQAPLSLKEIITQTPLSAKVNFLDYIRTPDRVLKKIGFEKEARLLREGYDGYVVELPHNIDKITAWADRVPKDASKRIFEYLDGAPVTLSGEEQKVAGEIRAWLEQWADRLDLPKDKRITHYITHIFDDELIAKEFDEDLAKIIEGKIPGQVYDPFLEKRLGAKGYKQDVWQALDAYTKRATRKVHVDPALRKMQDKAGSSLEFSRLEKSQYDYLQKYVSRVNMRPTNVDNLIDNAVKQVFGYRAGQRPVTRITQFMRRLTYRSFLGLNLGSALRNLSQGINTYAVLGERDTALGYMKLFSKENRQELIDQGIFSNTFIQDRSINATRKLIQNADKGLWLFFDIAEKVNRGSAYLGAKTKYTRKNKRIVNGTEVWKAGTSEKDAIEYAKSVVRRTQFNYDPVDTPVALSSDIVKTLLQFQTYTTKQTEFLTELAKDRNFAGLLRYALAGYAFVYTIGEAFGMEPKELLPINTDTWTRFELAPSMKIPKEIFFALMNTPDDYGNPRDLDKKIEDVTKTLWGLVPAGSQIKKMIQGYGATSEGASYDKSGKKQYEVGGSPAKDAQAVLFGKYANKEAKNYYDKTSGDTTLDTLKKEDNAKKAETRKNLAQDVKEMKDLPKDQVIKRLQEIGKEDPKYAEKVLDALMEEKQGLTSTEKKLKNSSVEVRAQYIDTQLKNASKEERGKLIQEYAAKGILTESVMDELVK